MRKPSAVSSGPRSAALMLMPVGRKGCREFQQTRPPVLPQGHRFLQGHKKTNQSSPREARRLSSPIPGQERSLKCVSFQPGSVACVILPAFFKNDFQRSKFPLFGFFACILLRPSAIICHVLRRDSQAARQRTANPFRPVRLRFAPPFSALRILRGAFLCLRGADGASVRGNSFDSAD